MCEHGDVIENGAVRIHITRDRIAIHSYTLKSRDEFEKKKMRSNAMGQAKGWDHIEGLPQHDCIDMAAYDP